MTYSEQLSQPQWHSKKNAILAQNNCRCQHCGRSNRRMEVHHVHYIKGRMAWEYPDSLMMCLCTDCHTSWHEEHDKVRNALAVILKDIPAERVHLVAQRVMAQAMEALA